MSFAARFSNLCVVRIDSIATFLTQPPTFRRWLSAVSTKVVASSVLLQFMHALGMCGPLLWIPLSFLVSIPFDSPSPLSKLFALRCPPAAIGS